MRRNLLVSAAAVMAITGAAAISSAQMDDKGKGPGSQGPGPSMQGGAQGGERSQQSAPGAEQRPQKGDKGADRQPGKAEPRAAQRDQQPKGAQDGDRDRSKSAQPRRDGEQQKATERKGDQDQRKAADRQRDKDQKAADRQRDKDQKSADRQRDKDQKAADRQRDKDQQKSTEQRKGDKDQQKTTQGRDQKQGDRVQVSEEKRSGVRERLVKETRVERVERSRINVNINVGARLPRSVRLHTLPVHIVSFAPAYRGYSYILLEDETICIVDPRTYVIVDVIPAGSQRADRPGRTHLTLSAEDMRFIYRTVPKQRTADVRIRLALGAEVPRGVELLDFPAEIVERVPNVRRYRYIVTERDVVIVDPNDYEVALVINE